MIQKHCQEWFKWRLSTAWDEFVNEGQNYLISSSGGWKRLSLLSFHLVVPFVTLIFHNCSQTIKWANILLFHCIFSVVHEYLYDAFGYCTCFFTLCWSLTLFLCYNYLFIRRSEHINSISHSFACAIEHKISISHLFACAIYWLYVWPKYYMVAII